MPMSESFDLADGRRVTVSWVNGPPHLNVHYRAGQPRYMCQCKRCGKFLVNTSGGIFEKQAGGGWVGTCHDCLTAKEG